MTDRIDRRHMAHTKHMTHTTDTTDAPHDLPDELVRLQTRLERLLAGDKKLCQQTNRLAKTQLHMRQRNGRSYYDLRYLSSGKPVSRYLGKADHPTVRSLQQRRFLQSRIASTAHNLQLLSTVSERYRPLDSQSIMQGLPAAYRADPEAILPEAGISDVVLRNCGIRLLKREAPLHPEHLTHRTAEGFMVRSKSEVVIINSVFVRGIAHLYEPLIAIRPKTKEYDGDGVFLNQPSGKEILLAPDLLLQSPSDGQIYLWEHFGMLAQPRYFQHFCDKLGDYIAAGFTPGNNLIITSDTVDGDLDSYSIERLLDVYFG